MALLRVAEALCALADGALRQLADWVEWEPSREASEECGQSRSVNRWRSLLWSAAQFPVLRAHTRTQHSSIHPLSVIVLGFFSSSLFLFSPHLPKSSLLCSCWATSSQKTPPTSVVGLSVGAGLRAKDGVLTGSMSWWHKRTGIAIFMLPETTARHVTICNVWIIPWFSTGSNCYNITFRAQIPSYLLVVNMSYLNANTS